MLIRCERMLLRGHPLTETDPSWAPDGRIVFARMPDGAKPGALVMRCNGTGFRQITATNGVTEWGAEWQRASSR